MEGKLIKRMILDNGLALEIFDKSRRVVGDKWLVSFEARIKIEVKQEYFRDRHKAAPSFEEIRNTLGEAALYRYETARNFISEDVKDYFPPND